MQTTAVKPYCAGLNELICREIAMDERFEKLLEVAKRIKLSPEDLEKQRRSFAYGNTKIENDLITREMIDDAAEKLARK